jgi:hypothetical protein
MAVYWSDAKLLLKSYPAAFLRLDFSGRADLISKQAAFSARTAF